ncbi:MAG TPA: hypothetical protein VHE33_14465 [Acidobacteriaceae bacterium]|nr:hypothetical protein [Acidobacteriaceae bacterium]
MVYTAGQQVRILHSGAIGRVFLKLPLRDVYLVQFPGFPVVEKIYYGCDLEPVSTAAAVHEEELHHV